MEPDKTTRINRPEEEPERRTAEPGAFRFARESVDTAHVVNARGFFWVRRHRALGPLQTPCSRFSATAYYVMLGLFAVMPLRVSALM